MLPPLMRTRCHPVLRPPLQGQRLLLQTPLTPGVVPSNGIDPDGSRLHPSMTATLGGCWSDSRKRLKR